MASSKRKLPTAPAKHKMHVRKGDNVQVISGKSKGVVGKVKEVIPSRGYVIVEGVNVVTKHVKPRQEGEKGRIVTVEAPIHASNVMLYSTKEACASRVGYTYNDRGVKVRILKKTGEVID